MTSLIYYSFTRVKHTVNEQDPAWRYCYEILKNSRTFHLSRHEFPRLSSGSFATCTICKEGSWKVHMIYSPVLDQSDLFKNLCFVWWIYSLVAEANHYTKHWIYNSVVEAKCYIKQWIYNSVAEAKRYIKQWIYNSVAELGAIPNNEYLTAMPNESVTLIRSTSSKEDLKAWYWNRTFSLVFPIQGLRNRKPLALFWKITEFWLCILFLNNYCWVLV